jgi:hypothetical protein
MAHILLRRSSTLSEASTSLLLGAASPQPQAMMLDAPHLPPMTSPALTTTEGLPADTGRSATFELHAEDTSEFGEGNSETNDVGDDQPPKPQPQKRRRVTRACDECRRKKIKCDGKQPCTHCTVYSYGMFVPTSMAAVCSVACLKTR